MRKKILNKNLNILNAICVKKLLAQEIFKEKYIKNNYIEKIFNDFIEPEIDEDEIIISDPMLAFTADILDIHYYAKYKGFDSTGWDCLQILVDCTEKEILNKIESLKI